MALVIGAKLEYIMVQLAFESSDTAVWEPGTAKARDSLFWFRRPELLLVFLHYILFQVSDCSVPWSLRDSCSSSCTTSCSEGASSPSLGYWVIPALHPGGQFWHAHARLAREHALETRCLWSMATPCQHICPMLWRHDSCALLWCSAELLHTGQRHLDSGE